MTQPIVQAQGLSKTFRVPVRGEGLKAALRGLARREYEDVAAVKPVSFTLEPGEITGFIGPNGAGKTTTLKMLAGLIHPSAGSARVAGFTPWERRDAFLRQISMVLGNKSQMMWDIPPMETFNVLSEIYRVPRTEFRRTLDELVDLLDMRDLLARPVRTFSLGERMKCELVAGLLHRPAVLFLDEPTLGLDVLAQNRLRTFIRAYNQRTGATSLLTSHYMADVAALCPRVILIHEGSLIYDGPLGELSTRLAPYKLIQLTLAPGENFTLPAGTEQIAEADGQITLRVARGEAPALTAHLLNQYTVSDLAVQDPPLEAVIDRIYTQAAL